MGDYSIKYSNLLVNYCYNIDCKRKAKGACADNTRAFLITSNK